MKALLLVDWYQAKKYGRMFFVLDVFFIAVGLTQSSFYATYFPSMSMVLAGLLAMSLLAYDEQSRWNIFAQALPCTRKQQVGVKYLGVLVVVAVTWTVLMLMLTVKAIMGSMPPEGLLFLAPVYVAAGLIPPSILLPIVFRFGMNKGRIVYIALIMLISVSGGVLNNLDLDLANFTIPTLNGPVLAIGLVLAAAAVFAGSWALASRWYEKREL